MTQDTNLRVALFGARGNIGRHVVDQLLTAGFLGRDKVGSAMTRPDIATFLVRQLTDDTYIRAMPAISN